MQIFFPGGILMPALRPPNTVPAGDNRLIQVRARRIIHLRRLKERYLPELGDIIEIKGTDYEYRAYCTHEQLAAALAAMALDIDYVKSKSQATVQYKDEELYAVNNAVWGTLYNKLSTHKVFSRPVLPRLTATSSGQRQLPWWDDARTPGPATPTRREDDDFTDMVPEEWDNEVTVTRRPNGTIDHSHCGHGGGKAARRRCRRQNSR